MNEQRTYLPKADGTERGRERTGDGRSGNDEDGNDDVEEELQQQLATFLRRSQKSDDVGGGEGRSRRRMGKWAAACVTLTSIVCSRGREREKERRKKEGVGPLDPRQK